MTDDIERLGRMIAALPPVPQGWVAAAQELPRVRRGIDEIIRRAEADAELKTRLVAELASVLAESGITPTERILSELRERMPSF